MNNIQDLEIYILSKLINNKEDRKVLQSLDIQDFNNPIHRNIIKGIKELEEEGKDIDILTVGEASQVEFSYLAELTGYPDIGEIENQVRSLKENRIKSELRGLAREINESKEPGVSLLHHAKAKIEHLEELGDIEEENPTTHISDTMIGVFSNFEKVYSGDIEPGISTGYYDLDNMISGLEKGKYTVLGARPAMGKTALALNIATNVAKEGKKVLIFSYEMNKATIGERILQAVSGVNLSEEAKSEPDWEKIINDIGMISNFDIYLNDNNSLTINEIHKEVARIKPDVVIIDYIQIIPSATNIIDSTARAKEISGEIRNMANKTDAHVIAISSLNRRCEGREDKRPVMSDLLDSAQVEHDADIVMFLYRDYVYSKDEEQKHTAELIIRKNRSGSIGTVNLLFQGEYTRFLNAAKEF